MSAAQDRLAPTAVVLVRELDRALDRLGAGVGEERHVEVAGEDRGEVVAESREVRREVRLVHLHPASFGEPAPGGQDSRVVVPVVEDADAAGEVEDGASILRVQVGAFGVVDEVVAEAERGHQADLAFVDVPAVQVVHLVDCELFGFVERDERRHGRTSLTVRYGRNVCYGRLMGRWWARRPPWPRGSGAWRRRGFR